MAAIMGKVIYPFIHNGYYTSKFMQKRYERQMADSGPYNRAFVGLTGRDKYDMSFISKESIKNQFASDLITPLPLQIDNGETEIHIFYAKKMGKSICPDIRSILMIRSSTNRICATRNSSAYIPKDGVHW